MDMMIPGRLPRCRTELLYKDGNGGYRLGKGHCYRGGSLIEALLQGNPGEASCRVQTKAGHGEEDYYLMGYEDIPMEGLSVRVR